jgi:hypothetical protein
MRYPDPDTLRDQARALRAEALSGIAREGAIKWRSLMDLLRKRRPPLATAHAPHPCQVAPQTHP